MKKYTTKRLSLFKLILLFSFAILYNSIAEAEIMGGPRTRRVINNTVIKKDISDTLKVVCYVDNPKIVKTPNERIQIYGSKGNLLIDIPSNSQYVLKKAHSMEEKYLVGSEIVYWEDCTIL